MEIKSLILGIVFTLGIFAFKSGIGLNYLLFSRDKGKFFVMLIGILSYFFIFAASYFIIKHINILDYFQIFENFLKTGIVVHLTLAIGMILWGIHILTKTEHTSLGYLLLLVPCPLCFITVFLCLSFLVKFTGSYSFADTILFYSGFLGLQIFTMMIFRFFSKVVDVKNINNILGYGLVAMGCYFIGIFCFAPVFGDIDKIYRMSSYLNSGLAINQNQVILLIGVITIIVLGFITSRRRIFK